VRRPWLARGLTLEQRIETGLLEVMEIVRPEEYSLFYYDRTYDHLWQHVDECRARAVMGIRLIAGTKPEYAAARKHGGGATEKFNRRRKDHALRCADDLLSDFGGRGQPKMTRGGYFEELARLLYEIATGTPTADNDFHHAMRDYRKDQGWGDHRRKRTAERATNPDWWTPEHDKEWTDLQERRRKQWLQPPPESSKKK
jgi:hypothetical protein